MGLPFLDDVLESLLHREDSPGGRWPGSNLHGQIPRVHFDDLTRFPLVVGVGASEVDLVSDGPLLIWIAHGGYLWRSRSVAVTHPAVCQKKVLDDLPYLFQCGLCCHVDLPIDQPSVEVHQKDYM